MARAKTAPIDAGRELDTSLGKRLRLRRHIRGLSLQELSDKAGLSIGLLSQIERNVTTPSLRSIRQICAALEMPVGWLFEPAGEDQSDVVTRRGARRRLDLGPMGMSKELMSPDAVPEIQMIQIVIQPGGSSGDQPYNNPHGAKCGTVLSGRLGLEVDGEQHVLEQGDSFAFRAEQMHRFWCVGDTPVDIIWVVTPAIY